MRQSFELGADIGEALRVYSDEMRTKRLLRAEETANKLPVKLVLPLGTCIFPVILLVIMVPVHSTIGDRSENSFDRRCGDRGTTLAQAVEASAPQMVAQGQNGQPFQLPG